MSSSDQYLIVFEDLIGSTKIGDYLEPDDFAGSYMSSFHWAANRAMDFICAQPVFENLNKRIAVHELRIQGDEALCFQALKGTDHGSTVASAVCHAYLTKLFWLASPYGIRRLKEDKKVEEIAVGINKGEACIIKTSKIQSIAGFQVNVTKRIENAARDPNINSESKILASEKINKLFNEWQTEIRQIEGPEKNWPPLLHSEFKRVKGSIDTKGTSSIYLYEFLFPKESETINILCKNLIGDFNNGKIDIKHNPWLTFSSVADCFFEEDVPFLADYLDPSGKIKERIKKEYIKEWFAYVHNTSSIFNNSAWHILNSFFMSCAFLIIAEAGNDPNLKEYKEKTVGLYDLYETKLKEI